MGGDGDADRDGASDREAAGAADGEADGARARIFQPLPPLIVAAAAVIALVEARFQLGAAGLAGGAEAVGWRVEAMRAWGFVPPLLDRMVVRGEYPARDLLRLVSYGAIHASAWHAGFAVVLLLALGKAVSDAFSAAAMAAVMAAGLVAGALAYWLALDGRVLLVGSYPAIYGLIGAFTWGLWRRAEGRGRVLAFRLVAVLIGLQLLFRLFVDTGDVWVAEAGGFAAGFGLAFLVAPDGGARLRRWRDRLRAR